MKGTVNERAILLGQYIVDNDTTVRDAAKAYRISKSTVHKDVTHKLAELSPALFAQVKTVLERNKAERHMRGGEATRRKYIELRSLAELRNKM